MKITVNENNMMVLSEGKLELYVYQKYIGTKMGIMSGSTLETIGLLPYRWYKKVTDTKPTKVGTMTTPSMIVFHPTTIEMDKTVKIYPESDEKKYTIMTFEAGTEMWSQYGIKSLTNAQIFVDAILTGKFDNNIPYTMLVPSWLKNLEINSMSLNVPVMTMEMIVHSMCKDRKTGKPFGEVLGNDPKHSLVGYDFLNVREASAASIFGALSFEDQNAMLDVAINMTLQDKEQRVSPLEKIIKY